MKLRIHAESIRLRLKQSEVRDLVEGREVVESCSTVPAQLIYALRPDATVEDLTVNHDRGRLTVRVPSAWLAGWETDERVGFASQSGPVELMVEKDWKCTNPASPKDNEDCFENPVACE